MVDVAVQGLVHSEHEPSHTLPFLTRQIPGDSSYARSQLSFSEAAELVGD
jgi:hypothetical protein